MIREPTVGMRVKAIVDKKGHKGTYCDHKGTIVNVGESWVYVSFDDGDNDWPKRAKNLTEIKGNGMKKGDLVKVEDCSYSMRMDLSGDVNLIPFTQKNEYVFKVHRLIIQELIAESQGDGEYAHDIIIEHIETGEKYLHTRRFLEVKQSVKELTVADIEEKYGCKVKIVKE